MDRLCARIFLLLVTGALFSNAVQEDPLNVHLEPNNIQVCEGQSVTIICTFQPAGKYRVKLYYSQTPNLDCNSVTDRTHEKWHINTGNNDTWSTFNITSIQTTDSGWYFCRVTRDIPYLLHNCSNGIHILVDVNRTKDNPNKTENQTQNPTTDDLPSTCSTSAITSPTPSSVPPSFGHWWIWLAGAVGIVVLVVSVVVVICIFTRKTTEVIYENTKPVESGCCRRNRTQMDICNISKKTETIKPLRKYDTLSSNRNRKP